MNTTQNLFIFESAPIIFLLLLILGGDYKNIIKIKQNYKLSTAWVYYQNDVKS